MLLDSVALLLLNSVALLLVNSVALLLIHSVALLLLDCVALRLLDCAALLLVDSVALLLVDGVALLAVLRPASGGRSSSVAGLSGLATASAAAVVLALGAPGDPRVDPEAAEERGVLRLHRERLGLGAEQARCGEEERNLHLHVADSIGVQRSVGTPCCTVCTLTPLLYQ